MRDDESTLVNRMLRGDEAAFNVFVDEYYPRLYRFAYPRVERDAATAQDVVQATFQKVIAKLASYRGEAALFSWMCTFCRFEIAGLYRRRSRALPEVDLAEDSPEVQAAIDSLAAAEPTPEQSIQQKDLARLVRLTLDALPLAYGRVLEWKYFGELSVHEIANRLGVSVKAAESLLSRARRAFKEGFFTVTRQKGEPT